MRVMGAGDGYKYLLRSDSSPTTPGNAHTLHERAPRSVAQQIAARASEPAQLGEHARELSTRMRWCLHLGTAAAVMSATPSTFGACLY